MKMILLLLLAGAQLALGNTPEITLEPNKDDNRDYGEQLITKFNALLQEDKELKAQLDAFEAAPKERSGGRYQGREARPLLLHQSVSVDFRADGGRRNYTQVVVLYYVFTEGYRRYMEESSGVFAVFNLNGEQLYETNKDGGDHELVKHTVTAKFNGFRKTLSAEQDGSDQPATAPESKPAGKENHTPESEAPPR